MWRGIESGRMILNCSEEVYCSMSSDEKAGRDEIGWVPGRQRGQSTRYAHSLYASSITSLTADAVQKALPEDKKF